MNFIVCFMSALLAGAVLCQAEGNGCKDNPCGIGTCVPVIDDKYYCQCPSSKLGTHCELDYYTLCHRDLAPCTPNPCGVGKCIEKKYEAICDCPVGYHGKRCEIKQDVTTPPFDPCKTDPCWAGTCKPTQGGRFFCECPELRGGILCQIQYDK